MEKWVKCQWVLLDVQLNSLQDKSIVVVVIRKCGNPVASQRHEVICHRVLPNVIRFSKGVEWRETD